MRITRRQLKRIIRESFHDTDTRDDREWEDREWERGYQDGLDGIPPEDDATLTYVGGYEDGTNDAGMPGGDLRDREEIR